jgi:branched-chain amino acid transport system substrate-binding protein
MRSNQVLGRLTRCSSFIILVALSLVACASSRTTSVSGDNKTLILATELPIAQASQHDVGIAVQNGVDLAVHENADLGGGYHLTVQHFDDSSAATGAQDPAKGLANMDQIVANHQIVAIIGPYNSNVAAVEIPYVNIHDGPVLISPSNTNPGLTLPDQSAANGLDYATLHPPQHKDFYFRIPGTDLLQGKLLANICLASTSLKGIGATTAFVLDDDEVYGIGLAKSFSAAFSAGGGKVLGSLTPITKAQIATFGDLANTIVSLHPDVIFFGGSPGAGAGELKQAVAAAGAPNTLWVVGSGIVNHSAWFSEAGAAAAGIFGTVAGPDLKTLSAAAAFVAKYQNTYKIDPLPYSAYAYDGAMIEISAMKAIIASGQPVTRVAIRARVAATSYTGVTGTIAFDANGDNTGNKIFSIWAVLPTAPTKWSLEQNVGDSSI